MKEKITLRAKWYIRASQNNVFKLITDFEKWPVYFPKVAESITVHRQKINNFRIDAEVRSFGKKFPVKMQTRIIPGKGFVSDNESYEFGTSGHEELLLSEYPGGTIIDYKYEIVIHKFWLRIVAGPLISWFSMKYWQKAVIDELRKMVER